MPEIEARVGRLEDRAALHDLVVRYFLACDDDDLAGIGAAFAAHANGLTWSWQRLLAIGGGGLLIIAGAFNLPIADGSAVLFVGLPGYFAWIVWLAVTGARLVRTRVAAPS